MRELFERISEALEGTEYEVEDFTDDSIIINDGTGKSYVLTAEED